MFIVLHWLLCTIPHSAGNSRCSLRKLTRSIAAQGLHHSCDHSLSIHLVISCATQDELFGRDDGRTPISPRRLDVEDGAGKQICGACRTQANK